MCIRDRGLALKKLCAKQGLHPDEVMVFGDSLNDLSMMREFRYSFAMANAEDIIKEAAGYQTLSNADVYKRQVSVRAWALR